MNEWNRPSCPSRFIGSSWSYKSGLCNWLISPVAPIKGLPASTLFAPTLLSHPESQRCPLPSPLRICHLIKNSDEMLHCGFLLSKESGTRSSPVRRTEKSAFSLMNKDITEHLHPLGEHSPLSWERFLKKFWRNNGLHFHSCFERWVLSESLLSCPLSPSLSICSQILSPGLRHHLAVLI